MKLYLIENYGSRYPDLSGKELTNALLRDILRKNGVKDPVIKRSPEGKPFLEEGGLCFSVSHTRDLFGCLISSENAGLDLQYARSLDCGKLSRRYFTEEEQRFVEERGAEGFFRLWARKEALCKYTGKGLSEILEKAPVLGRADLMFTDFSPAEGLYGSCCCACTAAGVEDRALSIITEAV